MKRFLALILTFIMSTSFAFADQNTIEAILPSVEPLVMETEDPVEPTVEVVEVIEESLSEESLQEVVVIGIPEIKISPIFGSIRMEVPGVNGENVSADVSLVGEGNIHFEWIAENAANYTVRINDANGVDVVNQFFSETEITMSSSELAYDIPYSLTVVACSIDNQSRTAANVWFILPAPEKVTIPTIDELTENTVDESSSDEEIVLADLELLLKSEEVVEIPVEEPAPESADDVIVEFTFLENFFSAEETDIIPEEVVETPAEESAPESTDEEVVETPAEESAPEFTDEEVVETPVEESVPESTDEEVSELAILEIVPDAVTPAEELAAEINISMEELAELLDISVDELNAMSADEIDLQREIIYSMFSNVSTFAYGKTGKAAEWAEELGVSLEFLAERLHTTPEDLLNRYDYEIEYYIEDTCGDFIIRRYTAGDVGIYAYLGTDSIVTVPDTIDGCIMV